MSAEFTTALTYNTNHTNAARFVLSHMRRHPLLAFSLVFGAFSNAALAVTIPYFIGQSFNALTEPDGGGMRTVGIMTLALIGSQLLRSSLQLIRNLSSEAFGQRIERDVRDELYASLLGKSMNFHDTLPVGEIMARVTNDVREMNLMMNPGVNLIIGAGWFLVAPVVSAPIIHPSLILIPLLFLIFHLIVQYRFVRSLHPVAQEVRSSFGRMNAHLAEILDGLQVVKGAAQEKRESERFDVLADEVRDHFIHQGAIEARYLSYLLLSVAFVVGFLHASILYQQGEILVGDIVSFSQLILMFGFPVFTSLTALSRLALGYASAGRILSIITSQSDLDLRQGKYRSDLTGEIVFENVTFSYDTGDKNALENINFKIKPGQTVAIAGQTGSGKSTVTKLINRIYDTTSGCILIDGVDVRQWDLAALRPQISIIEQDIFLFSRTIAENIAFGNSDAKQEQIETAARKAQAHEFIMSFSDGYETVIGQRGVTLSGGQRQRLAIARAFLTDPPVLILDDSTSAIDSATEDKIQQAIWSASQGRTTVLITHRLSQIRWADHIVVLRKGQVVAQGKHEDLLQRSESYRRIFARYEGGN